MFVVFNIYVVFFFFFLKQKTAYEMRISDWSSDVCSSDLIANSEIFRQRDLNRLAVRKRLVDVELIDREIVLEGTGVGDLDHLARSRLKLLGKIGRASCRERVCQYVSISVVDVALKRKNKDMAKAII